MSASLDKSLSLSSPLKVEEVAKVIEKQGIVSILGSDCERNKAASLRRTLSADMSSKKWLSQHGFSPMKKIASSEQFPISRADSSSSSSEGEEEYESKKELERPGQDDVWWSIQAEKEKRQELEKPAQFDNTWSWSSILSQKANEDPSKLPPPYIHPLVKRSASCLSQKSLEICTESLGSETGSDGFSSETGDVEEDKEESQSQEKESQSFEEDKEEPQSQEKESQSFEEDKEESKSQEKESQSFDREERQVVNYSYFTSKKSSPKSFPPPLASSIARGDGTSLHMQSRRQNGRLVLEAVAVPSQNYFQAQRQDSRLLLKFVNSPAQEEEMIDGKEREEEEFAEVFEADTKEEEEEEREEDEDDDDDDDEEEEEEMVQKDNGAKEIGIVMQLAPKLSSSVINVHRSALMMNRLMGTDNRNPTWTEKFNKAVNLVEMEMEVEEEEEEVATQLPQSLPPPPLVARLIPTLPAAAVATSFNAYDYLWRTKPSVATMINPLKNNCNKIKLSNTSPKEDEQTVYWVPLLRGCKETRRSLIWEPYCIATS